MALRTPRPASSVMLLRSNPQLEVLMVLRPARGFFGGLVVFPGGALEECDASLEGVEGDAEYRIAGLRETAEEVGIVVGSDGTQPAPQGEGGPLRGQKMLDAVSDRDWRFGMEKMQLVSRWVTPHSAPSRFDTRFYVLEVEGDPDLTLDSAELVDHAWAGPEEALAKHEAGSWSMILPTISHLRWLSRWATPEEALAAATGTDGLTVIEPELVEDRLVVRYRCEHAN